MGRGVFYCTTSALHAWIFDLLPVAIAVANLHFERNDVASIDMFGNVSAADIIVVTKFWAVKIFFVYFSRNAGSRRRLHAEAEKCRQLLPLLSWGLACHRRGSRIRGPRDFLDLGFLRSCYSEVLLLSSDALKCEPMERAQIQTRELESALPSKACTAGAKVWLTKRSGKRSLQLMLQDIC